MFIVVLFEHMNCVTRWL